MKAFLRRLSNDQAGLTAIELAVVVAILAILAALVAGSTSGMSTNARGASKITDISEVQKAVDNYKGQNPTSGYPTADGLITSTTVIAFDAQFTTPDVPPVNKKFNPDFVQRLPKHSDDHSWIILAGGVVSNTTADSAY